ncbi:MAG: type II secretion system F family protein, partial [Chthoniobacteraceae bacterium]
MGFFTYQALRPNGEKVSGELQALSRTDAHRKLDQQNLQPVSLQQKDGAVASSDADAQIQSDEPVHLSRNQIILFTEELSDLLDAGLQLETALRIMQERTELSGLKQVTIALRQKVRDGVNFSSALRSVSSSFGELYCNLVAAGEVGGALPQLLRRQTSYLVAIEELQSQVAQALVYPAFIFGAGVILLFVFMTCLVPRLTLLLTKTGAGLPLPTRILIGVSSFFAHYWWAIIAVGMVISLTFWRFIQGTEGRFWWDKSKLKIPVVGPVLCARAYAQFSHTMSNLLTNGVPMLNGLRLTHKAASNCYVKSLLGTAMEMVAEGGALSQALKKVGGFPALMVDIVYVGEQTGNLPAAFEKVGARYEKELAKKIQRLTGLIQPVVIILMALLVGIVAYSIIT